MLELELLLAQELSIVKDFKSFEVWVFFSLQDINPSSSTTRLNSSHKKYPTRKAIGKLNPEIPHQETEIELILRSNTYSNSEEVIESRLDKYLKRKCEFSEPPAKKLKESGQSTIFKYFKRPNP